jgi:enamine deaminase RidA (YjgF/YER057c/UK114 family)
MQQPSKPETRIQELHLTLPAPAKPVAKYKMTVQVGNLLYVSGHSPAKVGDKAPPPGKVGADLTLEQGKEAARGVGLNILSTVRNALGSLDKVKRLVKTLGMVNCTADFKDQPQVINGFSELMAEVFGRRRRRPPQRGRRRLAAGQHRGGDRVHLRGDGQVSRGANPYYRLP